MANRRIFRLAVLFSSVLILGLSALPLLSQEEKGVPVNSACPLELLKFNPGGVSVIVKNVSEKKIVGLIFHAALADPAEHWKWLHWDFDEHRPLRDFGWSKPLNPSEIKKLTWDHSYLDFEHGGGGAFVLTSVLFEDGSAWEEPIRSASCKFIWYAPHKKAFFKAVVLPPRR